MEVRSKSVDKRSDETIIMSYCALYLLMSIPLLSFHVSHFVHMIEGGCPFRWIVPSKFQLSLVNTQSKLTKPVIDMIVWDNEYKLNDAMLDLLSLFIREIRQGRFSEVQGTFGKGWLSGSLFSKLSRERISWDHTFYHRWLCEERVV